MNSLGWAIWNNSTIVKAGQLDWFDIEYHVGQHGLQQGGGLRIHPYLTYHAPSPWTMIRWSLKEVRAFGEPETILACSIIQPGGLIYDGGAVQLIEVINRGRDVLPKEVITIRFLAIAQATATDEAAFHVEVDTEGRQNYSSAVLSQIHTSDDTPLYGQVQKEGLEQQVGIRTQPTFKVVPNAPAQLAITVSPPSANQKERRLVLAVEDICGNLVTNAVGQIEFDVPEGVTIPHDRCTLDTDSGGHAEMPLGVETSEPSRIQAVLKHSNGTAFGVSGPFLHEKDEYNIYFGDIHAHSALSDGLGTAEEYYTYGRDVQNLSVCALADHNPIKPEGVEATEQFNQPGRFVTLLGWEWKCRHARHHKNIYYPNRATMERLMPETPYLTDTDKHMTQLLYDHYRGEDAIIISHHPNIATTWAWKQTDWSWHEDETERLVEICQICGNSETDISQGEWGDAENGASVRSALDRGYRFGFIGGTDDHNGHPGGPTTGLPHPIPVTGTAGPHYNGLAAFLAKDLTRESIWEAMKARRTYATTGDRILLRFEVNGTPMGGEVRSASSPIVMARVFGTDRIETCDIIKNGIIVHAISPDDRECYLEWEDNHFTARQENYYYFRVRQANGQMAWASPVWILCSTESQ